MAASAAIFRWMVGALLEKQRRWTLLARHLVRRLVVQQRIDALALVLEFRQRLALQRFAARQADAQRIDLGAVDDQLVMQVRAGGLPVVPTQPITWPWRILAPGTTPLAMALW